MAGGGLGVGLAVRAAGRHEAVLALHAVVALLPEAPVVGVRLAAHSVGLGGLHLLRELEVERSGGRSRDQRKESNGALAQVERNGASDTSDALRC